MSRRRTQFVTSASVETDRHRSETVTPVEEPTIPAATPPAVRELLINALHDAEHTGCTHDLNSGERVYYGQKADDLWAELVPLLSPASQHDDSR